MTRLSMLFNLSLFVVACSSTQWVKPGATEVDLEADTVSCNNEIVTSSIGGRAVQGMGASTPVGRTAVMGGARVDAARALEQCLTEKGWTKQDKP